MSKGDDSNLKVEMESGKVVNTDHMVVAVGIEPDLTLAKSSKLEIDPVHGGFKVGFN